MTHYLVQNGKTDKLELVKSSREVTGVDRSQEGGPKSALLLATLLIKKLKKNFLILQSSSPGRAVLGH